MIFLVEDGVAVDSYLVKINQHLDVLVTGTVAGTIQLEQLGAGGWAPISGGEFTEAGTKTLVAIPHQRIIRATGAAVGDYVEVSV